MKSNDFGLTVSLKKMEKIVLAKNGQSIYLW